MINLKYVSFFHFSWKGYGWKWDDDMKIGHSLEHGPASHA